MENLEFYGFALDLIFLLVVLLLCSLVGRFAERRGRNYYGFFATSLVATPLVGFIIAALLGPTREKMDMTKCPQCAELVKREAVKCRFCGSELVPSHSAAPLPRGSLFG